MFKYIQLCLIFSNLVLAEINLTTQSVQLDAFPVMYYVDESKAMSFQEIKRENFLLAPNKKTFSSDSTHLWIKIPVINSTQSTLELFLHHHNAYRLKKIQFYETKDETLLTTLEMNLSNPNDLENMYGSDAIYKFSLQPNETKTIYIQATSFIYQYYNLRLFSEKPSAKFLSSQHLFILIVLSILTGLMVYHFILYFITFFKDYLYYSLYLFFNIVWGTYEYGLLSKYLGLYGEKYFILHFTLIFSTIFLTLFIKNVLQMKKLYPRENKFMMLIIVLLLLNLGYVFVDFYQTLFLFVIVMNMAGAIYVGVIISLYRKKDRFILYILFAQIWYIIFNYIGLAFYEGLIEYNTLTRYAYILGIFLDTFAFSYLLSHRIRLLQEENKKSKYQSKRLEALSELLENISHQWRQPLTRINSSTMRISLEMKKNKIHNDIMDKKLHDIEELSVYLSQTIDDFKSLYSKDRESKQFNLKQAVQNSLEMLASDYEKNNITVTLDISKDIYLHNYFNEFQQVLQVIFNNAQDALISNQTPNSHIWVVSEKLEGEVSLKIANNGGEIDPLFINKIFEAHFSTKKSGEGIGLFMSQKIIKELMSASLTCHNIAGGVCFEIKFQL